MFLLSLKIGKIYCVFCMKNICIDNVVCYTRSLDAKFSDMAVVNIFLIKKFYYECRYSLIKFPA